MAGSRRNLCYPGNRCRAERNRELESAAGPRDVGGGQHQPQLAARTFRRPEE